MMEGSLRAYLTNLGALAAPGVGFRQYLSNILDFLLVLVIAFLAAVKIKEFFNVDFVLLAAAMAYALKNIFLHNSWNRVGRLNLLDASLAVLVVCETINYFVSTYRPNSFLYLNDVFFFFLFYWLVRFNLEADYQRTALFVYFSLWGVFLAGASFYYSWILHERLGALGFQDVTDFRNYIYFLNPIGLAIGVWCTILFLLLPFPLILLVKYRRSIYARCLSTLATVAILTAMVLTFIRGVYIALFAFFIVGSTLCWLYRLFPVRTIVTFNLTVLAVLGLAVLPVMRPALTTLSLFKTSSQVRSFEGRKKVWRDSLQMIKEHPWFGVGSNNFTMQYLAYRSQDEETAFALRPFNYFIHVLTEEGAVGLLASTFLLFSFFLVSHQKVKRLQGEVYQQFIVIIFATAWVSILVRDISESSILNNRGVGLLLWFMFANNAQSTGQ
jgi:O-antigen ligase